MLAITGLFLQQKTVALSNIISAIVVFLDSKSPPPFLI